VRIDHKWFIDYPNRIKRKSFVRKSQNTVKFKWAAIILGHFQSKTVIFSVEELLKKKQEVTGARNLRLEDCSTMSVEVCSKTTMILNFMICGVCFFFHNLRSYRLSKVNGNKTWQYSSTSLGWWLRLLARQFILRRAKTSFGSEEWSLWQ
jgi:hypothetical protein